MGRAGHLPPSRGGMFVKLVTAAPAIFVEAGRGIALRLALIALLVMTMLVGG